MKTGTFFSISAVTVLLAVVIACPANAACTWSFNWYCGSSGCTRTMGRSTGTADGFASEAQCEAARSQWRRQSVNTGSCNRSGVCDSPSSPSRPATGSGRYQQGGGYQEPAIDYEALRRAEEERLRQEAEEAERLAREKAEDERRQRQFMSDKLETLKSMKGGDFDGAGDGILKLKGSSEALPLKSGSDTMGIKPNPGADSPQPALPAEKSSRFSKGTQFSAPVDLTTKDPAGPLTVDAGPARELIPDGQLGKFIAARPWPPQIKGQAAIALIDLERGRPERAAATLKEASKAQPKDEFLRKAAARAAGEAGKARLKFDPERFAKQLPKSSYHAYIAAWEELEKGNMNGAARLFSRALDGAPNNSALQQLVAETAKRSRILSPEEQRQYDQRIERARDYAQGNAALRLGLNAIHWNNAVALNYLGEAGKKLSGLDWEFVRLTKQQVADRTHLDPGSYWKYHYKNRGEAMLDALEYGKGDWAASLRYLKHAGQIQKGNPVVNAAYRDLERLSKEISGK